MSGCRATIAAERKINQHLEHLFLAFAHLAEEESDSFNVYMSTLYGVNRAFKSEATMLLRDYVAVIALMLEQSQTRGEIHRKDSRRMRRLVDGTVMIEAIIEPGMRLAGHPLREAKLRQQCLVVSIRRQKEMLFPRGSTIIEPGDTVTFLVSPSGEMLLRKYLEERVEQKEPVLLD